MYAGSKYVSHYTVWTAWISIRVRVRVRVYSILKNLAPPGTTVHVPTAFKRGKDPKRPRRLLRRGLPLLRVHMTQLQSCGCHLVAVFGRTIHQNNNF